MDRLFAFSTLLSVSVSAIHVPLYQHSVSSDRSSFDVAKSALYAVSKHTFASKTSTPDTLDGGFWYGSFAVGSGTNLSLLIDTGSSDTAVNPTKYKPSQKSVNRHQSGTLRYGTTEPNGCGNADIAYNVYTDSASLAGLTAPAQTFGWVQKTTPPDNDTITQFPHDGIVGFSDESSSEIGATPFFSNLCNNGVVAACRFGLAFKTDGTGTQVLGSVDTTLFSGSLTTARISSPWTTSGDVAVGNTVIARQQTVLLDSGTSNVIGPTAQVKKLLQKAGIKYQTIDLPGCATVVMGSYRCNQPPTNIGFAFPSGNARYLNIEGAAFQEAQDSNGDGNCTATVTGIDFGTNFWIVGQSWMQGKYVDFNFDSNSVGFATLNQK